MKNHSISDSLGAVFGKQIAQAKANPRAYKYSYYDQIRDIEGVFVVNVMGKEYKVGTHGSIVAITGQAKSRKTTALAAIVASSLCDAEIINFRLNTGIKKVVFLDTEQNKEIFQRTQRRIMHLAGLRGDPQNYEAWQVRGLTVDERLQHLRQIIEQYGNNLGAVVIDGLVDLCTDFNTSAAANELINEVMQMSDKTGAVFFPVLHQNEGSQKMRGHLGTELKNKCDGLITFAKDETTGYTIVSCKAGREFPFPNFEFTQNEFGYPVLSEGDLTGIEFEPNIIQDLLDDTDKDETPF